MTSGLGDEKLEENVPLLHVHSNGDEDNTDDARQDVSNQVDEEPEDEVEPQSRGSSQAQTQPDSRFIQPTPSPWKRLLLIVAVLLLFWLAFETKRSAHKRRKLQVIYASRYSKEHKFRPAASPIITETLKDGRIKIYGGQPTPTPDPILVSESKKKEGKPKKKKGNGKGGSGRKKKITGSRKKSGKKVRTGADR